jgi:putative GTP pyrophosphokinase
MNWNEFLTPYQQAMEEIKVKLAGLRSQCEHEMNHSPIEQVTGRVKPIPSILEKKRRKQIDLADIEDKIQDIAGVRVVCPFVDDIYTIVRILRDRTDFKVVEEKDYITRKKASGYRSYHLIIEYPVEMIYRTKTVLVEIQIRTLAMNFWAINEHSLNYKYEGQIPEEIKLRLERAAEAAFKLDEELSTIRDEIQEAKKIFYRK